MSVSTRSPALAAATRYFSRSARAISSDLMQAILAFPSPTDLTIASRAMHLRLTLSRSVTESPGLHTAHTTPGSPPPVPTSTTAPSRGSRGRAAAQSSTCSFQSVSGSAGPVSLALSFPAARASQ